METLRWEHGSVFWNDLVAYSPNLRKSYYVGVSFITGKFGAIGPDNKRIGAYDTEAEALEACEVHFATNGGW